MIKQSYTVRQDYTFTPYIAAALVQMTDKFKSRVLVEFGNKKANGKSLMGVLTIGFKGGDEVTFITDGEDEAQAMEAVIGFFNQQ